MKNRKPVQRDPLEVAIETVLRPGQFIDWRMASAFNSDLCEVAAEIDQLASVDPGRAVRIYESFLAGCYEKTEEIDDDGFGIFIERLYCGWVKARQAAGSDPDKTASLLLDRMEDDPYSYTYELEREAVKVMNAECLAAFERAMKIRFEAEVGTDQRRHRWGEVLRAIYAQQQNADAFVAVCRQTKLSSKDCLVLAGLHLEHKPDEALAWIERGLLVDKKRPYALCAGDDLAKLKRELLARLGRQDVALAEAWADFQKAPSKYRYEELMRFVPKAEVSLWYAKALDVAERGDVRARIELLLETQEMERLARCIRETSDNALENLSHFTTEPVAEALAEPHPELAAKLFRAMGMRILNAKRSKYYHEALENFEDAKSCYALCQSESGMACSRRGGSPRTLREGGAYVRFRTARGRPEPRPEIVLPRSSAETLAAARLITNIDGVSPERHIAALRRRKAAESSFACSDVISSHT